MTDYEMFDLGNLRLQSGATLRGAKLAYKTYGRLNPGKDNAIVFPTFFGGQHYQNEAIIGADHTLDPDRYFIIVPNMMGNGLSSSPSNTPMPYDRARFPGVSLYDNVTSQRRLVTELFGIERIALVVGWSMGAQQAYQWGQPVSPDGGAHRAHLRVGADIEAQLRVPGGGKGRADRRRRLGQRVVREAAL